MPLCIPKFAIDEFEKRIKSGEFSADKYSDPTLSTEQRRAFFDFLGEENAKTANALFESKLLLKNQELGLVNAARKILDNNPKALNDTISKIQKLNSVLAPDELHSFLQDLAEKKLGIDISPEVAGKLVDYAKRVNNYKDAIPENSPNGSPERLKYGAAITEFKKYFGELKNESEKKANTIANVLHTDTIYKLAGTAKALKATLDNSFFGRQGLKVLITHPSVWAKSFIKSWTDIGKELKGVDAVDSIKADIFSRKNALNGKYAATKTAIGLDGEEAIPVNMLDRIPVLGRLFKGAESAYNGAALRMRADIADILLKKAEDAGINTLDPAEAKPIGRIVNSLTGRGDVGRLDSFSRETNLLVFSLKFFKSNVETITDPFRFKTEKLSPFARKEAAMNLTKIVGAIGTVAIIAKMLSPEDNKDIFNPASSNFGKIKVGATTFDISGGMGSLVTLAGRLIEGKSISSAGKETSLTTGKFGMPTRLGTIFDFIGAKGSPLFGAIRDYLKGTNFDGNKVTIGNTVYNLAVPLPLDSALSLLQNKDSAPFFAAMILDGLGISTNTPPPKK